MMFPFYEDLPKGHDGDSDSQNPWLRAINNLPNLDPLDSSYEETLELSGNSPEDTSKLQDFFAALRTLENSHTDKSTVIQSALSEALLTMEDIIAHFEAINPVLSEKLVEVRDAYLEQEKLRGRREIKEKEMDLAAKLDFFHALEQGVTVARFFYPELPVFNKTATELPEDVTQEIVTALYPFHTEIYREYKKRTDPTEVDIPELAQMPTYQDFFWESGLTLSSGNVSEEAFQTLIKILEKIQ